MKRNEEYFTNILTDWLTKQNRQYLKQLHIGKSIADVVSKGVVYEIKSDCDNFSRLERQLTDYYKAFRNVVVVIPSDKLESLRKKLEPLPYAKDVGIVTLDSEDNLVIVEKAGYYNGLLDYRKIFNILRQKEFKEIVYDYFGELPFYYQVTCYTECFKKFKEIEFLEAQELMWKKIGERT